MASAPHDKSLLYDMKNEEKIEQKIEQKTVQNGDCLHQKKKNGMMKFLNTKEWE